MALLTSLVPDVQVEIPEIPSFVAERHLLRAAREFCEETNAWRVSVTLSVVANAPTINLAGFLPANTELVDIITMKNSAGGEPLEPRTYAQLDRDFSQWRTTMSTDAKYYVLESNNVLRLVYTPSTTVADKYFIRFSVKPLITATELSDLLVNKYDQKLINGALGRLYMLPRKPWTDFNLGQYYNTLFMGSWPEAKAESSDEYQVGVPRRVQYGGL